MTIARRVFHPPQVWPKKDTNAFNVINLTVVNSQKEELESDLEQDDFMKVHKNILVTRLH